MPGTGLPEESRTTVTSGEAKAVLTAALWDPVTDVNIDNGRLASIRAPVDTIATAASRPAAVRGAGALPVMASALKLESETTGERSCSSAAGAVNWPADASGEQIRTSPDPA